MKLKDRIVLAYNILIGNDYAYNVKKLYELIPNMMLAGLMLKIITTTLNEKPRRSQRIYPPKEYWSME